MEFKKVYDLLRELGNTGFWGTVQIEFRRGVPYMGQRIEKVLFREPYQTNQSTKESV